MRKNFMHFLIPPEKRERRGTRIISTSCFANFGKHWHPVALSHVCRLTLKNGLCDGVVHRTKRCLCGSICFFSLSFLLSSRDQSLAVRVPSAIRYIAVGSERKREYVGRGEENRETNRSDIGRDRANPRTTAR